MTARQEAHAMIDEMPEESIQALIPVMAKLIPFRKKEPANEERTENSISSKMQAFLEMEELRKQKCFPADFDWEAERREAVNEKYGSFF